ncbi:hypothetical protein [Gemmatimonas sp.]|uniref:hypothetical protein n=1 Tax=Gemmatimonas sp. TaxID=1962908 RepID=UPI00286EB24B|nr:hypothetical protein [Gemmatimonas sp.]
MRSPNSLRVVALVGVMSLLSAACPDALFGQARPKPPAKRDTLTAEERTAAREATRDARSMARRQLSPDSVVRRLRADSASASAFSDPEAKLILVRAREARVRQDSALRAYKATATQRISMGMGAKRLGLEKLLFRGDNVAEISWRRDIGVRVRPIGSRITVPMASSSSGDFSSAISIPYFPGRESLWFPSSNFGVVKSDIDEREVIHPLANGAETYYKYATGDSVDIKLDGGRVIKLRELRITARRPDWRVFVGSFWFDRDGGQLVRAAYRLAMDLEIWDVASEETEADKKVSREADRLRDSIARVRMPRDLYVKDSIQRAPAVQARAKDENSDEDVPVWVKATFRPAKAKLDAISVEYGLYQGKFWLPRANSATASMQLGFVRTPFSIDEKFTYEDVNGDFSLAAIPAARLSGTAGDSSARDTTVITGGNDVNITVGGGSDKSGKATKPDTTKMSASARARYRLCQKDSTYTRVESRYEGALRVAYDMPCDASKLANSPALPPAVASDEELFDIKSRDELLSALDLSLQPGWMPQMPTVRLGSDLLRFNRVEGFSAGVNVTQLLGAGYTLNAVGRIGHADLHANGELSLARSNGARTVTATVYHRLAATNPEWGGGLSFGPSLPAFIYGRDEGFYYRTMGAELGERRERRRGALEYKLFIERQWTAGDTDVVNTFSLAKLIADRRFRRNIESENLSVTGVSGMYSRVLLERPKGLRFTTVLNGEAGTGTFQYARASVEGTVTRPVSRFSTALTGAIGSSLGDVPRQRGWFLGGVRTVRGQIAGTQDGDAFWLARAEVGTKQGFFRPVGFFDIGWAGSRDAFGKTQPQRGAGVGVGLLDGLIRVDFSRGLYPLKQWRTDFYLSAAL